MQSESVIRLSAVPVVIVPGIRHLSDIAKAIVQFDAIDMVNPILRPLASHVQPSKTMRSVYAMVEADNQIAGALADISQ